jgi:predicted glycoside hydrolase/deacetylase ChbG (UPF0249 family)
MRRLNADAAAAARPAPTESCVADDWGISPGVNRGILRLCEAGLVRGVSLLANSAHLERDLDLLLRLPGLRFSLHLNFTYGRPLSRTEELPSLCRPDGSFHGLPELLRGAVRGKLKAGELELEAGRQARRLKALGIPLTGLEGHHHVHLVPRVFSAVAHTLRREGINWVRLPADRGHVPRWLAGTFFRRWTLSGPPPALAGGFELRPAIYLRPRDIRSAAALKRKFLSGRGRPVIVHPALYNDLPRMEHHDPYQLERVMEFSALLRLSRRGLRGDGDE